MNTHDRLSKVRLRDLSGNVAAISPAELNRKLENGEIVKLIEVSEPDEFRQGHINGSINVHLGSAVLVAASLYRPYEQLAVYAPKASSIAGQAAARELQKSGFQNVLVLTGGKEAWRKNGFLLVD